MKCNLEDFVFQHYLLNVIARNLAQSFGKVISVMPAIGNIARLMTRRCYFIIESHETWDSIIRLTGSDFCITEMNSWTKFINSLNLRKLGIYCRPESLVFSDASQAVEITLNLRLKTHFFIACGQEEKQKFYSSLLGFTSL